MQHLGLTSAQLVDYVDALAGNALISTTLNVLDAAGNPRGPLSNDIVAGQVLVDRNARVSRLLTLDLADPTGSLEFDPNSAADDALWLNNQLQVSATLWVDALQQHVECPYFTGPIHRLWRDGVNIHIDAHGKERRMLRPLWAPVLIPRDTTKVDAIRAILARAGETLFAFPTSSEMLASDVSVARGAIPWTEAQLIAESFNMQLYYRGDGYATLRPFPTQSVFSFTKLDAQSPDTSIKTEISGPPKIWFELGENFANAIEVLGAPPRGTKDRVRAVVYAPDGHPLSRDVLATDPDNPDSGVLLASYVVPQARTDAEAATIAQRILDDNLRAVTRTRFDTAPYYLLEEGDFVDMDTSSTTVPFRLDRFGLPVGTRGRHVMTVGYHTKTTPDRWQP